MTRPRIEFEDVLRWFATAGCVTIAVASAIAGLGLATRTLAPSPGASLVRFLFALLLVTAPYAELLERRERRLRRLRPEERLGFVPHGGPTDRARFVGLTRG
jgi:hypothetical protein